MTKKNIVRLVLLLSIPVSLYFVPWVLVWAWLQPLPETVQEQLDEALDLGFEGIIVYVDQTDKNPVSYAAGWHNSETKTPADPKALFKIASIGKLYDAVAITKLISQGLLALDQTLAELFPELKGRIAHAEAISLQMLVQHRSGIPNLTETTDFWINPPKSAEEALERVLDKPANFLPGEKYEYSNTNYLLLGMLVEKVTGRSKFQFIQETILNRLELKNTFASIHEVDLKRLMSGYYVGVEEDIKSVDYGSMIASAEDVGVFLRALNDGSLFDEGEKEIYDSIYVYEHTGLIPGYQSIAKYHKDIDAVVIQFTNTTDFDGYQWDLSKIVYKRILKILQKTT